MDREKSPWTWVYSKTLFEMEGDGGDCKTGLFYSPRQLWPAGRRW